jgi:nicotinamidase/pyrazinamidase
MKTLIIIDVQNDFCPGGALAVPEGDSIIAGINNMQSEFDLVVATQDWHPADHKSFASQWGKAPGELIELNGLPQVMWPDHCVQGTAGAEFHPNLDTNKLARIFQKGTDPEVDSYSGFFDNGRRHATGLGDYLREEGATEVHVCGLATDYCVKWTALDAASLGFKTVLHKELSRGVELQAGDCERAIAEMVAAGVSVE